MKVQQLFALDARSPGAARRFVRHTLGDRVASGALDDIVLATSELVTNAILHARTELTLVVDVEEHDGAIRSVSLSVADGDPSPPVPQPFSPESVSGRGLLIIDALAERWGYGPRPDDEPGKQVWATLDLPA
ncbi:MAG TPA: ATP-binding protein [Microthrixaceae bacterium]|nr:ATP-binding protein [Microthrixaceae bacterium]